MSVVYCQVEVSASDRSPVQRSPTECGASECDRKASTMRRPWPTGGLLRQKKKVWTDTAKVEEELRTEKLVIELNMNTVPHIIYINIV